MLTHVDEQGKARMVDVGDKADTVRVAVAAGVVYMKPATACLVRANQIAKGDVLTVAKIAGIAGAKKTAELIPLCHNITLSAVDVRFRLGDDRVEIEAEARCIGKTGVEMEALTATATAALTIYDMCKAVDKEIVIGDIRLLRKSGGKSGDFVRKD